MKIRKFSREKNLVTLEIEEEPQQFDKYYQKTAQEIAQKVKIPGFRPGKAPINVLEQQVGKDQINHEAANDLITECYRLAIEEKSLFPIDYPKNVKVIQQKPGEPFVFSLEVEVKPEVKLGAYKKIKVKREKPASGDQEVEQQLDLIRERLAEFVPVPPRPAVKGDLLRVDMAASVGGQALAPWSRSDAGLTLGGQQISAQFDEQLLGAAIGETKKFSLSFPADFNLKEAAGQTVDFAVTVKEIREKKLPELNDELAAKLGPFQSLEQVRQEIRKQSEHQAEHDSQQKLQDDLLKKVSDNASVEVPEVMIDRQVENSLHRLAASLKRSNLNLPDYLKYRQLDEAGLRREMRPGAAEQVKTALVLEEIAKAEDLKVEGSDVEAELLALAKETGQLPDKVKQNMNPENLDFIRDYLLDRKTIKFLVDSAQIEEEKGGSKK